MSDKTQAVRRVYSVSPKEAGQMLGGLSVTTILRYIRQGKLAASKLTARTIRIRVADIEAFSEARKI